MSSANRDKVYSVFSIFMPFMSLFDLKSRLRISARKRKMYGESGSPCLHPLCTIKDSERNPHCTTEAEMSL